MDNSRIPLPDDKSIWKRLQVPVFYLNNGNNEQARQLTFSLCCQQPVNNSDMTIHLTDDADPMFLWRLQLTSADFDTIKTQQNLLITFADFPIKFAELLDSVNQVQPHQSSMSSMQCRLTVAELHAELTLLETNTFRHINHLTLVLTPPQERTHRQYLSDLVQLYKGQSTDLSARLLQLEEKQQSDWNSHKSEILKLKNGMDTINQDWMREKHELTTKSKLELQEQQRQMFNDCEEKLESLKRQHKRSLDDQVEEKSQLDVELKQLDLKYRALDMQHTQLNLQLESSRTQLDSITLDHSRISQQQMQLQRHSEDTQRELTDCMQENSRLQALRETLELEVQRKDQQLSNIQSQSQTARSDAETLSVAVNKLKQELDQSTQKSTLSTQEVEKANEIICKLQLEVKNLKAKMKLKNVVAVQQEKAVEETKSEVERLKQELSDQRENHSQQDNLKVQLESDFKSLEQKCISQEQVIADNKNGNSKSEKLINVQLLNGYTSS